MEIEVKEIKEEIKDSIKVTIFCNKITKRIQKLRTHIEAFDERIKGKQEGEVVYARMAEALYFEAVDNRTFLYMEQQVMEVEQRLYELEKLLPEEDFIRCSKSVIVNIHKIKRLKPELNRTILATMCNGEKISISRRYVKAFKELLGI